MKNKEKYIAIFLAICILVLSSCASNRKCDGKKGKKVPMGGLI